MNPKSTSYRCAYTAIQFGREIRAMVYGMPRHMRATPATSILKPAAVDRGKFADAEAERIGVRAIEPLAKELGFNITLVVNPQAGTTYDIGSSTENRKIWMYFDAVDGTVKVAGLGNDASNKRFRAANDGIWAIASAFTDPTEKSLEELAIGDFKTTSIVDGNPSRFKTYPQEVVALHEQGIIQTYDLTDVDPVRLHTSTREDLGQGFVYFEVFQAFDRNTNTPEQEQFANLLFASLNNRHEGGAFDLTRAYGTFGALQRNMLGWRNAEQWYEAQHVGWVVLNDALTNTIPGVATIIGAGGIAQDFDGKPLTDRKLTDGRPDFFYAANEKVAEALQKHIEKAKAQVDST